MPQNPWTGNQQVPRHDDPAPFLAGLPNQLLIGGEWREGSDGHTFTVADPATGRNLLDVADASPEDGCAALAAAAAAQHDFARMPPRERGEMLRRAFELLLQRREQFAALMTLEMGKPLAEARAEVDYGAEFLRWFSEEAVRVDGRYAVAPDGRSRLLVIRRPVGPCLFITPWNFPLAMATRKIAPAIAAGCTSVLKPAELTPLTALAFAAVLEEAGVPDGVVNVVPTTRAAQVTGPLLADGRLRKLSFTGSTPVGRALLRQSADRVLRTSMELGGNAPFLVFADADLDLAVAEALTAKLRNMGEACTAANRFLVHASVADEFATRLAEEFAALPVTPGLTDGARIGPLIDARARDSVHGLVTAALAGGARALTGGTIPGGEGCSYPPTVLVDVPADTAVVREEIFGPVAPIVTFHTEEEAVATANEGPLGLAGYAFTPHVDRILRLAEDLEVGMLGVNQGVVSNPAAPFGGVKESGLGREGGSEGIAEFLETIYVGVASTAPASPPTAGRHASGR
jgi:succinate-semialdehyde dehydrogenase / glutarate-semialdehyde dehydrogenase